MTLDIGHWPLPPLFNLNFGCLGLALLREARDRIPKRHDMLMVYAQCRAEDTSLPKHVSHMNAAVKGKTASDRPLALQLPLCFFSDLPRSLGLCTWGADGATVMSQGTGSCLHCPVGTETDRISVIE